MSRNKLAAVIAAAALAVGTLASGVAGAETLEKMRENYDTFVRYAGPPQQEIRNFRLHRWQPLGKYALLIWAQANQPYLVDVDRGCYGLDFAKAITTTAQTSILSVKFDKIEFGHERCRIEQIRPVDYKAYRADRKAAREAERRG